MSGAGDLDRRIIVERFSATTNGLNEEVKTWATFINVAAGRSDVSDGERFAAGQVGASLMSRFKIRSSINAKTVTPEDRISYDGDLWNILGIKETKEGRNRFLEITAVRRQDQ